MKLFTETINGYIVTIRIFESGFVRVQLEKGDRWIEIRKGECLRLSDIPTPEERKIFREKLLGAERMDKNEVF